MGLFLRRSKPEPEPKPLALAQPLGLVSLPLPGLGLGMWLKAGALALVLAAGAYGAGLWIGDNRGYDRRSAEVAKAMAEANQRIAALNEQLDAEHTEREFKRDVVGAEVAQNLKDVTPEVRTQCTSLCSLPAEARKALEKIQ